MNCTCKQCGLEYEYDDETGYSEDLCGAFCHGVNSQREKIERLTLELADRVTEVGQLNVSLRDKDAKIERLKSENTAMAYDSQCYHVAATELWKLYPDRPYGGKTIWE
ncbi:hypothetical protein M0R72_09500, partial [Candidatus Pacearchaeota archaeon]|nr:hypothetical protein [Candidatus Pacearchaeota archaeon]